MKRFLSILACLLLVAVSHAQDKGKAKPVNLGIVFRVQVGASTSPLPKTHKLFKDFPDLEGVSFPDGYIRYMTGSFESLYAAQQHVDEVKAKGYKDAYVTALQGKKRMTPDEAIGIIYDSK